MTPSFPLPTVQGNSQPEGKLHLPVKLLWFWHVIYILYSLEVGAALLFLPWSVVWESNYILYLYPKLQAVVGNPYLKGSVLGLGIVNLLIGIQEIANLRRKAKMHFSR